MSIGQRIRSMRTQQGLSIDDLAYRLGKNRTTIYRYENGDIENLPLGILDSLANALNTTPAYLMGWENSGDNGYKRNYHADDFDSSYIEMLQAEFVSGSFNKDELEKLREYARFLLSIRQD